MKQLITIVGFLLLSAGVSAQVDSLFSPLLIPKISLSSFLDLGTPAIEPGLEFRFARKWAYSFNAGLQIRNSSMFYSSNVHDNRYTKYKNEVRLYPFGWNATKARPYFGAEWLNMKRTYTKRYDRYEQNGQEVEYQSADVVRNINAVTMTFGCQYYFRRYFIFEMGTGLGVRQRNIRYSNVVYAAPSDLADGPDGDIFDFDDTDYHAGKSWSLNMTLFVRAGYRIPLKRKQN